MYSEALLRICWICVLLFGIGTCFPPLKSQTSGSSGVGEASGTGYMSGGTSGYGSGASGSVSGYTSGAAYSSGGPGFGFSGNSGGFGSGAGSSGGSGSSAGFSNQDADLARFLAALMSLKMDGSSPQSAWSSNQVPLTMAEVQSSYPVSHSVLSNGGYQRARDSSSFAKYSQDAFGDGADTQSKTGSKGKKFY